MASKAKPYEGQEILNKVFTGTALRSASTDGGTASATAGGNLATIYTDQDIWNSVVSSGNLNLA